MRSPVSRRALGAYNAITSRGFGHRELAHAEIVEDEQGHGDQELHVFFAGAVERGFGEIIEQGMGFAIEHAVMPTKPYLVLSREIT
jgi:hypothetical protein